eukprot:g28393.t1
MVIGKVFAPVDIIDEPIILFTNFDCMYAFQRRRRRVRSPAIRDLWQRLSKDVLLVFGCSGSGSENILLAFGARGSKAPPALGDSGAGSSGLFKMAALP